MKRLAYVIVAALALTACNNRNKAAIPNETLESTKTGYSDIMSFIVNKEFVR